MFLLKFNERNEVKKFESKTECFTLLYTGKNYIFIGDFTFYSLTNCYTINIGKTSNVQKDCQTVFDSLLSETLLKQCHNNKYKIPEFITRQIIVIEMK